MPQWLRLTLSEHSNSAGTLVSFNELKDIIQNHSRSASSRRNKLRSFFIILHLSVFGSEVILLSGIATRHAADRQSERLSLYADVITPNFIYDMRLSSTTHDQ